MALAELGETMSRARRQMLNATIIDEKVFNEFLDEISRALLQSDVPLELVSEIQTTMKETFNLIGDHNKKFQIFQLEIFDELCRILYTGNPSFTPEKGKASVIMFVGQGSEKTICKKYAYYHLKKGWKPALVCANTSRAGAFDQLEHNAINAKIPVYESHTESDLARVAVEGVERFKNENFDLIIVDTSGSHKQDASLFEEMHQVAEATKPDLVIFVMDSSIGQAAAFDQARAFKQSVSVGAVILTKMDGHAKGVGALSAVAATKSPVIFIGTGVLIDEFRVFDIRRFVSRILGMGGVRFRSMDKIHEVVPMDQQPDFQQNLFERNFTLRTVCERFQKKLERGSIGKSLVFWGGSVKESREWTSREFVKIITIFYLEKVIKAAVKRSRIELMPKDLEKELEAKVKSYVTLMDFMTDEELDNPNPMLMTKTQIIRIAQTSGQPVEDVIDMLKMYKRLDKIRRKKMKGFKIHKHLDKTRRKKMKGFKIPKKAEMSADEKSK